MSQTFHQLRVTRIQSETEKAVSIWLAIPENLREEFAYKQGQYVTIKAMLDGKEVRRSYSMSSSPLESDMRITIKRTEPGWMSVYLTTAIKAGDELDVSVPEGKFYTLLHPEQQKRYYFFAAGSGITPVMSLIRTTLEAEPLSTVYLFYGNREEQDIIFRQELDDLQKKYQDQCIVEHVLSKGGQPGAGLLGGLFRRKPASVWTGESGRLDARMCERLLQRYPSDRYPAEYFLCGPEGMIRVVEQHLLDTGIPQKHIHKEFFLSADPLVSGAGLPAEAQGDLVPVRVRLNGKVREVRISGAGTVLEGLIRAGVDAPYSCSSGACSTCMARVLGGRVEMDACYALDDSEIASGLVLTCQSRIRSEDLDISYDI